VTLLLALLLAAGPSKRLAVLDLDVTKTKGKIDAEGRASIEEMLRDESANVLRGLGWTVMAGENQLALIEESGAKLEKCGEIPNAPPSALRMKRRPPVVGSVRSPSKDVPRPQTTK